MKELIERWKTQLQRFRENPDIAKNMNPQTALGVQHARIITLEQCIKELEAEMK